MTTVVLPLPDEEIANAAVEDAMTMPSAVLEIPLVDVTIGVSKENSNIIHCTTHYHFFISLSDLFYQ